VLTTPRRVSSQKRAHFRTIPQSNTREMRPRRVRKTGRVFDAGGSARRDRWRTRRIALRGH
jgi:hypothetical protein